MILLREEFFSASILIVDDVDADVTLLECLLRGAGYAQVSSSPRAAAAQTGAALAGHDLILLDLHAPGEDGFTVLQGLRNSREEGGPPVIAMTTRQGPKLRALRGGATDTISKPFDALEVSTRVHNLLELRLLKTKLHHALQVPKPSSDWYWEQRQSGRCSQVAGPVQDMLGLGLSAFVGAPDGHERGIWIEEQRQAFLNQLATREAFTGFAFTRVQADGSQRHFSISGEPVFNPQQDCIGYRGVGFETRPGPAPAAPHAQAHPGFNVAAHSGANGAVGGPVRPAVRPGD